MILDAIVGTSFFDNSLRLRYDLRVRANVIFFLAVGLVSLCGEDALTEGRQSSKVRTGEELEQAINQLWIKKRPYSENWEKLEGFSASWSLEEIRAYHQRESEDPLWPEFYVLLIECEAYLNPEELIANHKNSNNEMMELDDRAGRGLESNSAESLLIFHWEVFNAMMAGWSRKDPMAAWNATKKPDGRVSDLVLYNDSFGYLTPIRIFENLAKHSPEYAWKEFRDFPAREYRELYRESILKGISRGLPDETDWVRALEKAIELSGDDLDDLKYTITNYLLSRWMEQDPAAAENWFFSKEAEVVSIQTIEISLESKTFRFLLGPSADLQLEIEIHRSLGPCITRCLIKNPDRTIAWLKADPGRVEKFLDQDICYFRDEVPTSTLRQLLVETFPIQKREQIMKDLLACNDSFRNPLEAFCEEGEEAAMRASLAELKISPVLIEKIIKDIRKQ